MKSRFTMFTVLFCLLLPFVSFAKETKDISFRFKNAEPVVFSHDVHLTKYNNNCKVCHNVIFNIKERRRFTMAQMEKTRSCGACHTGVKAFSVTDEKSCTRCHKGKLRNITFKVKGATSALFSHDIHIAKTGGKCRECHNGKVITGKGKNVTMAQMEKGKTCGACHDGKKAFSVVGNCGRCHKGFKPGVITFKTDAGEAKFNHAFHLGIYKCDDCHTSIFPYKTAQKRVAMVDMEKGKSCGTCHNGKDAFSTKDDCGKCHKM